MSETNQQLQVLPPEQPQMHSQVVRQIRPVSDPVPMFDTAMFEHMQRIATIMAESTVIPDSLRKIKVGSNEIDLPPHRVVANCFMVVNQAWRWKMDPFAVVQCASFVHGRLMWEGKLVAAVLDANLGVRLGFEFTNEAESTPQNRKLGVIVSGIIPGETKARTIEGTVDDWHKGEKSPWGSPGAWKRQLRYMGAREWARAHAPAIMLGVMADDEAEAFLEDRQAPTRTRPRPAITAAAAIAADIPEVINPSEEPAAAALAAAAKTGKPAAAPEATREVAKPAPAAAERPFDDDGWPGPRG